MSYEIYGPYIPVIMLITFIGLFIWVLLPGNQKRFSDASKIPFEDDGLDAAIAERKALNDDRRNAS